jgi:hypothetical protein
MNSKLYKCDIMYKLRIYISNVHTQIPNRNGVCLHWCEQFSMSKSLKRHIVTVHMGEKNYECDSCLWQEISIKLLVYLFSKVS